VDGLAFVRERVGAQAMPMAELFAFELVHAEKGLIRAQARPSDRHYNPLGVVQGGFASTVLDIALGLVALSVLTGDASGVGTIELSVRYLRSIYESTGTMTIEASILQAGRTVIFAQANLMDATGKIFASAQSSSIVVRTR
jgi:uncharacterized protein (TIGR00369 family)